MNSIRVLRSRHRLQGFSRLEVLSLLSESKLLKFSLITSQRKNSSINIINPTHMTFRIAPVYTKLITRCSIPITARKILPSLPFVRHYSTEAERPSGDKNTAIEQALYEDIDDDKVERNSHERSNTPSHIYKFKYNENKLGKGKQTVQQWITIAEANKYKLSDIGRLDECKISITSKGDETESVSVDQSLKYLNLLKHQLNELTDDVLPYTRSELNEFISPYPIYKNRNVRLGDEIPSKFLAILQAENLVTSNSKNFHTESIPFYTRTLATSLYNDYNQFSKDRVYKQSSEVIYQDTVSDEVSELFVRFNKKELNRDQVVYELSASIHAYLNTYPKDFERLEFFTSLFTQLDDNYLNFSGLENVLVDSMVNSTIDNQEADLVNTINQKRIIIDKFLLATLKKNRRVKLKSPSLPLDPGDIETSGLNMKYSSWLKYILSLDDSDTYNRVVRFYLRKDKPDKLIESLINHIMKHRFEVEGKLDKHDELTKLIENLLVNDGLNITKQIIIDINQKYPNHPVLEKISELESYEKIKDDITTVLQQLKSDEQKRMIDSETQKRFDLILEKNKGIFSKHRRIKTPYSELKKQIKEQVKFEVEELGTIFE